MSIALGMLCFEVYSLKRREVLPGFGIGSELVGYLVCMKDVSKNDE